MSYKPHVHFLVFHSEDQTKYMHCQLFVTCWSFCGEESLAPYPPLVSCPQLQLLFISGNCLLHP